MEKISVSVRVRPLSKQEQAKGIAWNISSNTISLCNSVGLSVSGQSYTFDRVFGTDSKTSDIYEARTKDIIASAVGGFNGTVFAYGQTSSGKTYTMRGSPSEPGITPLAVQDVFNNIEKEDDREFLLRVSYMEIYNEEINDLLSPENCKLQVHENLERGIFVAGLREEIVVSPEQVLQLMDYGEAHRHIGETNMNVYSSRSHTIFRMVIESRDKSHDGPSGHAGIQACDAVRVSVLNLVDLAGSERAAKTGAEGARLKEGSHINKSLMTLGTVINKLSEGIENLGGHVPYRDSKLTRILQPALGGNAKTAIICNITPAWVHVDETKGTLQFASRAIRVTNCAQVNEVLTDAALLKRQKKEIEELRSRLQESQSEHLEEEILNLRNAMLKAELEREHLTKQIVNLSTMVLNSAVDDRGYDKRAKKNNRRETWCPQLLPAEPMEIQSAKKAFVKGMFEPLVSGKRDRKLPLPPPFEKLSEEDEAMDHSVWSPDRSIDKKLGEGKLSPDQSTNFLEANTCMYVAERRKRSSMDRMVSNEEELLELQAKFQNLCWEHETAISEIKRLSSETEHLRRELSWHEKNSHNVKLANNLEGYQRCKSMGDCETEASLLMEALQVQGSKIAEKLFDESKKEEIQYQREMEMCDKVLTAAFCDLKDEIGNLQVYALDSLQMLMHDFRCLHLEISAKLTNKQDAEVPSQRRLKRKFDIICDGISPTTLDQSEIKIENEKNGLGDAVETAQYKLSGIDEDLGQKGRHFEQELQILADKLKCALEEKSLYEQERDVFAGKLAITEARNVTLEEEIDMLCREMDNGRYQAKSTQKDSDISVMEERSVTENVLLSDKHEILSNDVGKLRCESSRTIHCMEDLKIKLAEEEAVHMKLLLELESNAQQLAEKVELLAKQDTDFAHLVSINMELENTKELLEAKLQVQEAEIRRLEKEVNTVQADLERCCDQHHIETSQHRSEIAALRKEILSAKAGPSLIEKERDNMKKELDRLKLKTKDVEAKLKSTLQDKSKLEAERANMERELKALRGQSNLLQRDLNRRESMADKRRETIASGISKAKHQYSSIENAFHVKSTELEKANFELQVFQDSFAKIEASLTQAQETSKKLEKRLAAAEEEIVALKDEKSKLILENEGLRTEVEEKLHSAESELASARQYIESLVLDVEANLAKSETARLEVDALARQKEELLLELTNAHYQFEEERATMSAKVASAKDLSHEKDIYISSLTQKISSLNSHLEKVSGLEMEIVSTNEKCKKYEEEIMNVRQNMDEEHRTRCEIMCILEKKEVDLSIATKELENMIIASTKLRFAFDAMAARAEVFEGRLEDARWELIEFKEKVSRTHPHESAWASKLNNLEKKLAASRLQVVEMKIELESSRAECNKQKQILLNYQRAGGQAMEEHHEIKRLGDLVEEKDNSDLQLAVRNLHYQKRKLEDEVTAFKCTLSSTKKCAEDHQEESTPKRKSFDLLLQEPVSSLKKKIKDMEQKEKKEHIAAEQSQPGYPRRVALSPIKLNKTGLSIPDQNSPLKEPIKGKSNTLFTCNDTFPGFGVADPLKVHAISYGKENST